MHKKSFFLVSRFFRDSRNAPQFLNEGARDAFTMAVCAQVAVPLLAFMAYTLVLQVKDMTAAQAGVELPLRIFVGAFIVEIAAGIPLLASLLYGKRTVLDLEDLMDGVEDHANDVVNPINPVLVVARRISEVLKRERYEVLKQVNNWNDIEFRRVGWGDLSWIRKVVVVAMSIVALTALVYGTVLVFGLVPPHPLPASIDTTRPSGMMFKSMRSGELDWMFGLMLIVLAILTFFLGVSWFFSKTISKSDEALKEFKRGMRIE